MAEVRVEFFGIPRERAGTAATTARGSTLGAALVDLGARFPRLAQTCLDGPRLKAGTIANLNGARFVSDPRTPLAEGDAVLLLSADAGG
jgi:molybdopterin converting factor small subunit